MVCMVGELLRRKWRERRALRGDGATPGAAGHFESGNCLLRTRGMDFGDNSYVLRFISNS